MRLSVACLPWVRRREVAFAVVRFLLPSLSRRDNFTKYVNRTVSPDHTRHVEARCVLVQTQQSTTIKKIESRDNKVLSEVMRCCNLATLIVLG